MIAFVMAQVSRCAVASLCPSDDDLKTAIYNRTNAAIPAIARESEADNPGDVVLIHPTIIKGIQNVHCGEATAEKPATISCSFTVTYPSAVYYEIAELTRSNGQWTIIGTHAVLRKR